MPPLVIYFVGFVAVALYLLLPPLLAIPIAVALVLIALFRFRHLGRSRREHLPRTGPAAPLCGTILDNNPTTPLADESPRQHDHGHHHHDSASIGAPDGGAHHGGGDGGPGGHSH